MSVNVHINVIIIMHIGIITVHVSCPEKPSLHASVAQNVSTRHRFCNWARARAPFHWGVRHPDGTRV